MDETPTRTNIRQFALFRLSSLQSGSEYQTSALVKTFRYRALDELFMGIS